MNNIRQVGFTAIFAAVAIISACSVDDSTRIERAELSADQGEYREAAIELKNVLRSDPSNVAARVLLGKVSLESGDPETAANQLQRASELGAEPSVYAVPLARARLILGQPDLVLDLHPDDLDVPGDRADLNAVRGNAHLRKGDIDEAVKSFNSALSEQSGHPDALVGLAHVYRQRGDNEKAVDALRRVIAQHSDSHAAYSALGQLQMISADYASAEENFRLAIKYSDNPALRREHLSSQAGLIDALLAQKKSDEAQVVSGQLLKLAPENPIALFQAARADFEAGQLDESIDKTQRVISVAPDYLPARLLLATAAMSKENYALAEIHLRSVINADPGNENARRLLAQAQMKMGSPDDAFSALEPLLASGSSNPQLLTMAGSASLRSGDREKGLEYITRGLEAGSSDPAVQMQAVSSYIAAGEIARAIELLEKMPESMHGEQRDFMLILAQLRAGETEEARRHATRLLEQNPDGAVAHRIMGGFHMAVGEYDQARTQFEKVRELEPGDTGTIVNLARLDVIGGDIAGAEKRYSELLSRDPNNLVAMLGLSQLAEKAGDQQRAVELLEETRVAHPEATQPTLLLARYYLRTNRSELALERAGQALSVAPTSVDALNLIGQAQLQSDRQSEALETLERSLKHEPNRTETHYLLAQTQLKLGMNEAGRKSLEKTLELDPTHLGSRIAITRMESFMRNFPAALKIAGELRDEYPDRAEPQVLEGDIHIVRGHYSDAIKAYDRAGDIMPNETITLKRFEARQRAGHADSHKVLEEWLALNPDNVRMQVALAQAYQNSGLADKAVAGYERALETAPDNIVALNNLAWLYSEMGDADNLREGIKFAARAHELLPEAGRITDTYGWLLLKQGKVKEATAKLREAVVQAPDDSDIRYHLAVALQRSGNASEARKLLDAILSDDSTFSSRDDAKALRDKL